MDSLAQALQGAKRDEEARKAISQAIDRARDRPELYVVRGRMHRDRKDLPATRADFERAIARAPRAGTSSHLADTLVELGRLLLDEGKYDAARARFEQALKVRPDLVLIERFRALALLHLERNDEAAAALDRYLARTLEPVPEALQARGLLYARKGQLREAIEMYSAALRLEVKDARTRGYRAWSYLEVGANKLAWEDFEVCLHGQPASAEYLTGRAAALVRLREVARALADAVAAEREGPLTDRLCYHLSCVYSQAAAQVALEAGPGRNRRVEQTVASHERKALTYLDRAVAAQPEKDRARFWRDRVEKEPGLTAVRSGPWYNQLARKYGGVRGR
jgi:tetratricopeptide (TPR) repeat protein